MNFFLAKNNSGKEKIAPVPFKVEDTSSHKFSPKPILRTGLKIKIKDNSRCSGGTPTIGEWYDVTDINQPPKFRRREGIDGNVYFIEVDGVRTGVHGIHCEKNGFDFSSNVKDFLKDYRGEKEEGIKDTEDEGIKDEDDIDNTIDK